MMLHTIVESDTGASRQMPGHLKPKLGYCDTTDTLPAWNITRSTAFTGRILIYGIEIAVDASFCRYDTADHEVFALCI